VLEGKLGEVGIDSLMGVEIQLLVQEVFKVAIPPEAIKVETTVQDMIDFIAYDINASSLVEA
jgi:acyl carrier protein